MYWIEHDIKIKIFKEVMKRSMMLKNLGIIIFITCSIFSGCHFVRDAKQVTYLAKAFEEEGRMTKTQIDIINTRAKAVNYSDGINEAEARALAEKFLLDTYPQFLGWDINISDNQDSWRAICKFVETKFFNIDKESGFILPIFGNNQNQFLLSPK